MANRPMIWLRVQRAMILKRPVAMPNGMVVTGLLQVEKSGIPLGVAGFFLDGPWELESDTKVESNLM